MSPTGIADILLMIGSSCFVIALLPQIIKTYRLKRSDQLSLPFLCITLFGLSVCLVGAGMMELYKTAVANSLQLICYLSLIVMKIKYK